MTQYMVYTPIDWVKSTFKTVLKMYIMLNDGVSIMKSIPSSHALPNIQFFTESIINWEMKEDIADYFNSNPFEFAEDLNLTNKMLKDFCDNNSIYYLNLDIFSIDGMQKNIAVIENCIYMSC